MTHPPIVMQALWRTRGTYFWSVFRKRSGIRAYYEPLHAGLATNTDEKWANDFQYGGMRRLRHPKVDGHYFREYPLRPEGGVALFDRSISFGKFMLSEQDEDPALATYLASLVDYAAQHGQQAFFKFVRGGLRAAYIRRVIGGTQIYLNRPPSEIQKSFASFGPTSYFTATLVYLVICYAKRPFCAVALEFLRALGPFDDAAIRGRTGDDPVATQGIAIRLNLIQFELLVAMFWLAYLLEGLTIADVVIDTERLGCDADHRKSVAGRLAALQDQNAFADYQSSPCADDFIRYAPALRVVIAADDRLSALSHAIPPRAVDSLGDASRRLLDAIL